MNSPRQTAKLCEFASPAHLILWASRHFFWSTNNGLSMPEFVTGTFDQAGLAKMHDALMRVLSCLLAGSTERIIVHDASCPCVALHEQAILTALKRLQFEDIAGYTAALSGIMQPSAIRIACPDMTALAKGMSAIEENWSQYPDADAELQADKYGRSGGTRLH